MICKGPRIKILFLTVGPKIVASSRSRVYQYLPFFREDGLDYKVATSNTGLAYYLHRFRPKSSISRMVKMIISKAIKACNLFFSIFITLWFLALSNFYELLFIQKVILPDFIIKFLKRRGKKIVFDFDDAIYANPWIHNKQRLDSQIPLYDLVVIENTYTREYIYEHGNENVLIITGPIDCKRYYPKNHDKKDEIVIGWIGSPSTQEYLNMLEDVFKRLPIVHKKLVFELVGVQKMDFNVDSLRQKRWSLKTEVSDLQNFDIGIMALPDNEWTRGKGGYKLLQYMAVGIPYVASPVGINKELTIEGENGFLATSKEEWYEKLSLLVENPSLRRKMGTIGRDFVVKNYSFEVAAPRLLSALKGLI